MGEKRFRVDAYVPETNTIYEFLGDFWHGNPERFDDEGVHPFLKIPYKELYNKTLAKLDFLKKSGYNVVSIWENDYNKNKESMNVLQQRL